MHLLRNGRIMFVSAIWLLASVHVRSVIEYFIDALSKVYLTFKPFNGRIKTAEQRTIIQQYDHWYTGR